MLNISFIILIWKDIYLLEHCLQYLSSQTFKDFDIIIIDNGSHDDAIIKLPFQWSNLDISIKYFSTNLGFATANNIGANLAKGKWIALLNADAFPEPDWLEKLIQAAEQNPEYVTFSSRQVQYNQPKKLDGAGDAYHVSGLAWRNAFNLPADKNGLEQKETFSACAAAALYSREAFLRVGGFDEDYFSYFEDVDLGFRLRLLGEKCLYVPEAVVYHVGSASTGKRSDFSVYYGYRNMIWTFFKNMPTPLFWLFLPLHIISVIFFIFYFSLRGQGKAILKSVFDAIRGLPKVFQKRKMVQNSIKIKPRELLRVMSTGLFEPYIEFIRRNTQ
ncbi:MAG: glycosyltransferase family 2 protein [Deltaproteobacteria bacterium]|nr:glycosyltransferase family 2 protein [Deltaproteobacteria bacterium]